MKPEVTLNRKLEYVMSVEWNRTLNRKLENETKPEVTLNRKLEYVTSVTSHYFRCENMEYRIYRYSPLHIGEGRSFRLLLLVILEVHLLFE